MEHKKQNILVIGGGAAGVATASSLSQSVDASRFKLQLVTDRTYSVHWPAMLRAVATSEGNFEDLSLNPYDNLFAHGKAGEIVIGSVTEIDDSAAHLADGRSLPYDYLVLAMGTIWEGPLVLPLDRKEAHQWIANWQKRFASARSVVVIGGGAAGIELCGELRHTYPDKQITLIHAGNQLLNDAYPDKFRRNVLEAVKAKNINVVLKDRASVPEGEYTSITTENGATIAADVVAPLRGGKCNTAFLSNFDSNLLTENGSVKVLPTLRVPLTNGKTNVYAIGDIIDWPQQKTVSKVPAQAAIVAANILSSIKGQPAKKEYKGFMEAIVVPLGPNGGRGYLPLLWGIQIGDGMTKKLKSKTLFTDNARKALQAPA